MPGRAELVYRVYLRYQDTPIFWAVYRVIWKQGTIFAKSNFCHLPSWVPPSKINFRPLWFVHWVEHKVLQKWWLKITTLCWETASSRSALIMLCEFLLNWPLQFIIYLSSLQYHNCWHSIKIWGWPFLEVWHYLLY